MDRWRGRTALVTGAASGIGEAVTRKLVHHGMTVVGCDLNMDALQDIVKSLAEETGKMVAHQCNLCKDDDLKFMFDRIKSEFGGVDVCVNSAGMSYSTSLLETETSKWRYMMEVNVLATLACCRESVKSMRERGIDDGHIILMSSLAAHRATPPLHFYAATKSAVKALTEGLRMELRDIKSHIRVSSISPGIVETGMAYRVWTEDPNIGKRIYSSIKCLEPADIADAILYTLQAPPHVQIHDILIRPTEQEN